VSRLAMMAMFALCILSTTGSAGRPQEASPLIVYGGMHETLAKGDDQARVNIAVLLVQDHFYAVGAVAGLHGEITILDSVAYVTGVAPDSGLTPLDGASSEATLLVGQSVRSWSGETIDEDVAADRFDEVIHDAAASQGVDTSVPFMFIVEGEMIDVRLHVINGACPVHARMKKLEIQDDRLPFEHESSRLRGTIVGVYAPDAVGKLTHPATSVHAHLIYIDGTTGARVTGHLEWVGIAAGATVKVPAVVESAGSGGNR
jgi:alpha-acetolactate decarboxylase